MATHRRASLAVHRLILTAAEKKLALPRDEHIICIFHQRPYTHLIPNHHRHQLAQFSTDAPAAAEIKKSPHSKLLRVCSNRNPNPHFAALEAEILLLNWDKAMNTLVDDWTKNNKWISFTELESNVRSYVEKNLPFLVISWKRNEKHLNDKYAGLQLKDRIRMGHFPYEQVILAASKQAISGQVHLDTRETLERKTVSEIEARQAILTEADKMLKSMADFNVMQEVRHNSEWTLHHESCSKCFRTVLSGRFLMWRRMRDADHGAISESITSAEDEMYSTAMAWVSFCTNGEIVNHQEEGMQIGQDLLGGIAESDKTLLLGVAKGLLLTNDQMKHAQSTELKRIIDALP